MTTCTVCHGEAYAVSRLQSAIASVGSMEAFAAINGYSASLLQKVLGGQKRVSAKLAACIGLERVHVYRVKTGRGGMSKRTCDFHEKTEDGLHRCGLPVRTDVLSHYCPEHETVMLAHAEQHKANLRKRGDL